MLDEELVEYVRQNEQNYGRNKIRDGLLSQGISSKEIDEVFAYLDEELADEQHPIPLVNEEELSPKKDFSLLFEEEKKTHKRSYAMPKIGAMDFGFLKLSKIAPYQDKAHGLLVSILGLIGVEEEKRDFVARIVSTGAISFLVMTIIAIFAQYMIGQNIYPQIEEQYGVFGRLSMPSVFITELSFVALVTSLLGALLWGALLAFVFTRYIIHYWPFHYVPGVMYKLVSFYFLVHFISSVFLDGILISRLGIYMKGYGMISLALIVGAYIAGLYFTTTVENSYPGRLKTLLYERW